MPGLITIYRNVDLAERKPINLFRKNQSGPRKGPVIMCSSVCNIGAVCGTGFQGDGVSQMSVQFQRSLSQQLKTVDVRFRHGVLMVRGAF